MIYFLFIVGFILVIKGADLLIDGASSLARKFGISSIIIGLTVVAFGTSVPELVINVFSAIQGNTEVALGNIIGSNVANILLILGLTAAIFPLDVKITTAWKEVPFSLFAAFLLFILCNDSLIDNTNESFLSRSDGIILFAFFGIFLYYVIEMALRHKDESPIPIDFNNDSDKTDKVLPGNMAEQTIQEKNMSSETDENDAKLTKNVPPKDDSTNKEKVEKKKSDSKELGGWAIFFYITGGLIALVFGGKWVVDGAIGIATKFGMSQFLISATIVAVGSSLPELVTSLVAAYKKEPDLSVGNIVGSNIFNIFWVLGVSSMIRPIPVKIGINNDLIFLMVITLYLFLFMFIGKKYKLERWQGIFFTVLYVFYIVYIIVRG